METYTFLRELADSWALLAMTLFFLGVVGWVFRPGSREVHAESAAIALRNEDRPKCAGGCPDCGGCATIEFEAKT